VSLRDSAVVTLPWSSKEKRGRGERERESRAKIEGPGAGIEVSLERGAEDEMVRKWSRQGQWQEVRPADRVG